MITMTQWTPDAPMINADQADDVLNVVPIPNGWAPFPSFQSISSALASKCVGAISVRVTTSNYRLIVGTTTKLYMFDAASSGWTDLSGATTFSVPAEDYWQFALFGNYLLATNSSDGLYAIDLTAPVSFSKVAAAPKAKFIDVMGDFVVLGCLATNPNRIHWSAINDYTSWTVGTNNSDYQDFPDGGAVRGLACGEIGLVFQEDTIRRMTLVGDVNIFQFQIFARNRRIRAPYSIVRSGPRVFGWCENGLFMWSSDSEMPIGQRKVDHWLSQYATADAYAAAIGCVDPVAPRVYWGIKTASGAATAFQLILGYDWSLDRFFKCELTGEYLLPAVSSGYTLEGLNVFGPVDTLPASLDSAVWGGGNPGLGLIDATHKFGWVAGLPLEATIQTCERRFSDGRAVMTRIEPMTDAENIYTSVGTRERRADEVGITWRPETNLTDISGMWTGKANGRFHAIRMRIPAGESWGHILSLNETVGSAGLK